MKIRVGLFAVSLWLGVTGSAFAQQGEGIYVGAGVSSNSLNGFDDATGFQFFAGYDLTQAGVSTPPFKLAVEAGYMKSGTFESEVTMFGVTTRVETEADGLWATGVARYPVNPRTELLARLGLDLGDDDGLMFGVGVGYDLTNRTQLRGEFVARDNVDSLQINLAYEL